jgi:hypothetical protein
MRLFASGRRCCLLVGGRIPVARWPQGLRPVTALPAATGASSLRLLVLVLLLPRLLQALAGGLQLVHSGRRLCSRLQGCCRCRMIVSF